MRVAVYPGSFDPVTLGHIDIIQRTSKMFDKVIIGVLKTVPKSPLFTGRGKSGAVKGSDCGYSKCRGAVFSGPSDRFCPSKSGKCDRKRIKSDHRFFI